MYTFPPGRHSSYQRETITCFVGLMTTVFPFSLIHVLTWSPVCKAAKADLVFMVDGSWSIGDENFNKIINFLYSTVGALGKIGADGTQVRLTDQSLIHSMH